MWGDIYVQAIAPYEVPNHSFWNTLVDFPITPSSEVFTFLVSSYLNSFYSKYCLCKQGLFWVNYLWYSEAQLEPDIRLGYEYKYGEDLSL